MPDTVDSLRAFNRFYTSQIGLLDRSYLDSGMNLTEVRILYEIHDGIGAARQIAQALGLDEGYLSRVLARFSKQGLITQHRSKSDARRSDLAVTEAGAERVAGLIKRSRLAAEARLAGLGAAERIRLVTAMNTIQHCLSAGGDPADTVALRDLKIGDIGMIAARHGVLYAAEHGFDASFEPAVADILLEYQRSRAPGMQRAWIAARGEQVLGSVFCVRVTDTLAKLRLFYLEPEARGLGLGQQMLEACLQFATEAGYLRLELWTHDIHHAACGLYQRAGFTMISANPVQNYGKDLIEQQWQIELCQK